MLGPITTYELPEHCILQSLSEVYQEKDYTAAWRRCFKMMGDDTMSWEGVWITASIFDDEEFGC